MKLLCLSVIFIMLFSCTTTENKKQPIVNGDENKEQLIVTNDEDIVNDNEEQKPYWDNEKVFKQWLNDTLKGFYASPVTDYRREIIVHDDSLAMQVICYYNVNIHKEYTGNNADLIAAIGLLEINGVQVPANYNLEFQIEHFYSVSMVEQMPCYFEDDILLFKVSYGKKIIEYNFIRGRLNDSVVQVLP